CQQESYYSF
nr:immunoglobulin light chain junction region [Macaca mulatta]